LGQLGRCTRDRGAGARIRSRLHARSCSITIRGVQPAAGRAHRRYAVRQGAVHNSVDEMTAHACLASDNVLVADSPLFLLARYPLARSKSSFGNSSWPDTEAVLVRIRAGGRAR